MEMEVRRPYHDLDDRALAAAEATSPPEEDPVRPSPVHIALCNGLEVLAVRGCGA